MTQRLADGRYTMPRVGPMVVQRDGVDVSPVFAQQNDAFAWILRHQGQSVDYALQYGGYRVVPADWTHEAVELVLYADNDGATYRRRTFPVLNNLARKMGKGDYDRERAVAFLEDALKDAAKSYGREFMAGDALDVFTPAVRREAAQIMLESLASEVKLGNMPVRS